MYVHKETNLSNSGFGGFDGHHRDIYNQVAGFTQRGRGGW